MPLAYYYCNISEGLSSFPAPKILTRCAYLCIITKLIFAPPHVARSQTQQTQEEIHVQIFQEKTGEECPKKTTHW